MDATISKRIMMEYESLRISGVTNMFYRYNVEKAATKFGFTALAKVAADPKLYAYLLENYSKLMKEYDL